MSCLGVLYSDNKNLKMSFKSELFLFNKTYNILSFNVNLEQPHDGSGYPNSRVIGGKIHFTVETQRDMTDFLQVAISNNQTVAGYIRVYKRDGFQKFFDYEFANAYITYFKEQINTVDTSPVTTTVTVSAGIFRRNEAVFENYWNPNNPFKTQAPIHTSAQTEVPVFKSYHFETKDGKVLQAKDIKINQDIDLVILTEHASATTIKFNLNNSRLDFTHHGKLVENDILTGIKINGNTTRVPLRAIKP